MLVHAGDATFSGKVKEIKSFMDWFSSQPHEYKIFVAGNHDMLFEDSPIIAKQLIPSNVIYLQDNGIKIDNWNIWGSPWQPEFQNWSFNLPRGRALREKWDLIPLNTNLLITHSPPFEKGDMNEEGMRLGCVDLALKVKQLKDLKLHVFGHIHEGYGQYGYNLPYSINASICKRRYSQPLNLPVTLEM